MGGGNNRWAIRAFLIWMTVVGFGFGVLWKHEYTPGAQAAAHARWPMESDLQPDPNLATMIVFAHPKCPCTRATISELELLMARCRGRVRTQVLFFRPSKFDPGWARTAVWRTADEIPGVTVREDVDGLEAQRFGAETSGQIMLYRPDGHLMFTGGITGGRGHAGENAGRDALQTLLLNSGFDQAVTPVYGCAFFDRRCEKDGSDRPDRPAREDAQ